MIISEVDIIRNRKDGKSCREVAELMGIPEWRVWRCMTKHGLNGQFRKRASGSANKPIIEKILDQYDEITIERGCSGGYIASMDDKVFGTEKEKSIDAIRDAWARSKK